MILFSYFISFCNFSLFTNIFFRFSGVFIEKATLEEFVEICEQIRKEFIHMYNDEKDIFDSNIY